MPELPDLEYVVPELRRDLVGSRIEAVRTREPIIWRIALANNPDEALRGRTITGVDRRGHFVIFTLEPARWLVASLMLAGRFRIAKTGEKDEGRLCAAVALGPRELRYLDDKKMGKLYVVEAGAEEDVPGLATLGPDPLSPAFTFPVFQKLAAKRRDQVRAFIMDKTAIGSIGNAYADEILFDAKLHPKTFVRTLDAEAVKRLYASMRSVLDAACAEVKRRKAPIDEKVRDFLKVRNRKGEPCPRCGAKIRSTGVNGADSFFCPDCQPTNRSLFVDFRNTSAKGRSTQ